MMNKNEFRQMKKDLEKFDEKRESIIQQSRIIIKLSKQIIFSLHRDDLPKAKSLMKEIEKCAAKLPKESYDTDINKVAMQEYVEAATYYYFITKGIIIGKKKLEVTTESYLRGLCDLSGELTRRAVKDVIKKNYKGAEKIRNLVEELYGMFLEFDLRNGELRKKSDQIKWSLAKLEDISYNLSMKKE